MSQSRKRCAIYTRKSTEEGLEQEFNSLDAQLESCAAYILSQAGEGWGKIDTSYSDGGISGGHMERPGLLALIDDIEAGKVDVVVVYKVDRLTRSLADFAKLVEVFDAHDVSFVSITQAFNTTTSMGRLTLNVLLSFAQFEREVTAERIRDKIAASKKKGKWMGGLPPMGYDNVDTKLVINAKEAEIIRSIFEGYSELGSVAVLKQRLDQQGIVTKQRCTAKKIQMGGKPFSRGHLYKLLSNPAYIGKVRHKENIYEGEHDPIIDVGLWEAVQAQLKEKAPKRERKQNGQSNNILKGLLYDETGDRLTPVHTKKAGRRYEYYVSSRLTKGEVDDGRAWRLPALKFEQQIIGKLLNFLTDPAAMQRAIDCNANQVTRLIEQSARLRDELKSENPNVRHKALKTLVQRIELRSEKLVLIVDTQALSQVVSPAVPMITELEYSLVQKRRGIENRLILGGQAYGRPDQKLIKAIAQSRQWYAQLKSGKRHSLKEIAAIEKLDKADVSRALRLAFISPKIVSAILKGDQPVELTVDVLKRRASNLPSTWDEQDAYLGFTA